MSVIHEISVYSQTRSKRDYVGRLWREDGKFHFEYERHYQRLKGAVGLGPEFPLHQKSFSSVELFPSLADRIPSRQNPAYPDYCTQWGINENETDPFVLLTTIGRRGPSTFIFEPAIQDVDGNTIRKFREQLELNQREFAAVLGLPQLTVGKLERGMVRSIPIMTYVEMCMQVPQALKWLVEKRGQFIHDEKCSKITS